MTEITGPITIKNKIDGDLILGVNDGGVAQAGITVDGVTVKFSVSNPNTKLRCCNQTHVDAQLGPSMRRDGSNTITGDIHPYR